MVDADFPGFGRVRVINTHLQSSFSPADPLQNHDIRLHQIKKDLAGLVKNTRDRESLCVVMGDLNHHPVDPATGQVTAEYDYLVHGLHLADVTTAIARHRGLAEEAIFTFGPNIFYAERSYADAGFRLLFDRIHVGTTNPNHIVVVDLDESSIAFEDTFSSDHKAVKIRLSLSVYDLGPSAAINLGARVLYSSAKQSFDFANPLGRLAA